MKLSAPKNLTWIIAVVLGLLGLLGNFVALPVISGLSFWLLFLGFAVLAVATFVEGLQNAGPKLAASLPPHQAPAQAGALLFNQTTIAARPCCAS